MSFLKAVAGRIWAVWGLLTFVITFLLVFLPSMLCHLMPDPRSQRYFITVSRIWMRVWFFLVACPVRVRGKNNFQKGQSYIVTCNHNSLLDIPLSSPFIPGPNKTIAKTSFAKVPLFGFYYRKGSVLVDRKSERSRRQSFDEMKKVLAMGMHMCIYPEGTRNRTDQPLKKFYDGAFKLSTDTGKAIIPAVILNTRKAVPANKPFFFLPAVLEIHFLEPVLPVGLSSDELRDKVHQIMSDYFTAHQ
ncbi:1-acyl-sn-glycerol-3-phosphate acyltransferase [Nostoc ellipsosporum NOK]|nr:1-acyl-sn-glycerol-3-phosphate acyltransferase [Nostoc ellipsosporum NOK]